MRVSRRAFLSAPALLAAGKPGGLRIGVTDWNLRLAGKVEAMKLAKSLDFEGFEISLGRTPVGGRLALDAPDMQVAYLKESKALNMPLAGTCLDILHVNYLKEDNLAPKWVAAGISITAKLRTGVMLLPSFGKGMITSAAERDRVADVLKELCPEAERRGVVLAVENTLSAEDNARLIDRTQSKAVRVFYDAGNAVKYGHEPAKEIRWLGKDRIAQIHLKDHKGYIARGPSTSALSWRPLRLSVSRDSRTWRLIRLQETSPLTCDATRRPCGA